MSPGKAGLGVRWGRCLLSSAAGVRMRVVVVGAYGLIGGYVAARLLREGHEVVGVGRDIAAAARRFPTVAWRRADLRRMGSGDWPALLAGAEAVVNCAGALQDGPRDDLEAVHARTTADLAAACAAAGVRRYVQISAAGVEQGRGAFGRTKLAADQALIASGLDWVVLRPGLVLAPAAYGGSALLRGLAGFPGFIPAVARDAQVQVVSVDDVAEAVVRSLGPGGPARISCDLAAAEATRLDELLLALRGWLGLPPAPVVAAPGWVARLAAAAADALAWLGWRSPMRSAALQQLAAGVRGRHADAAERLGFAPRGLAEILAGWPSGVQERWFARLYFAKPAALLTLAVFWGTSGAVGLLRRAAAERLLSGAGISGTLAAGLVTAGGLIDIALATLVCVRATARPALVGMIVVTAVYLVGGTLWLPGLWGDPLGPLVKSLPAAMLALAALAMMDER